MRWAGHVARIEGGGEKRVEVFGGKAGRKKPLERPRRRCEEGIKIYLRKIAWEGCGVDSPGSG
jgi:hypothetical protein